MTGLALESHRSIVVVLRYGFAGRAGSDGVHDGRPHLLAGVRVQNQLTIGEVSDVLKDEVRRARVPNLIPLLPIALDGIKVLELEFLLRVMNVSVVQEILDCLD